MMRLALAISGMEVGASEVKLFRGMNFEFQ